MSTFTMQGGRVYFKTIPVGKHFRRYSKLWFKTSYNQAYCYQYSQTKYVSNFDGVFRVNESQALAEIAACWSK